MAEKWLSNEKFIEDTKQDPVLEEAMNQVGKDHGSIKTEKDLKELSDKYVELKKDAYLKGNVQQKTNKAVKGMNNIKLSTP